MNKKRLTFVYVFFDMLAAILAWALFFIYRKYNVDHDVFSHFLPSVLQDQKFYVGLILSPVYWLLLHIFTGYYRKINRKSRLKELEVTLVITFIGTLLLFFLLILDDIVVARFDHIKYLLFLFSVQFILTYIPRFVITTQIVRKIHSGQLGFNTLIIGSDAVALNTYRSVVKQNVHSGNYIIGYVMIEKDDEDYLSEELPCLGVLRNLESIVKEHNIEELIVAIQNGKRKHIESIITMVRDSDIVLKIIPQMQDFLMGTVRITSVLYEPLISISPEHLPEWQKYLKRFSDIFLSALAIIVLLPVYLFLAIGVKCSTKGPVFYLQERIGYKEKPFNIIKFRSMVVDAEQQGPQLSSKGDSRITPFGRFMRRSRLDETPQFFNVLVGDMSLVGPRPERQYYIDQIVEKAPHYKMLFRIKPGITSWGQVKFGYAENVDEMIQRLKWDILYLENMSIQMDIKILIYTIMIVLKRDGK